MPSIINALSTGSGGLVQTADASGVLQLQTNGTTALTVDTNANVTFPGYISAPNTFGFKNRIINGDMRIAQRGTSFSHTTESYGLDRFMTVGAIVGSRSVAQVADGPSIATPYCHSTTQSGSNEGTAAADYCTRQFIELQNVYDLAGKDVTVSFWYKSNRTGTHGARLIGNYASGSTGGVDQKLTFTVNAANTWEYKTITFTAVKNLTSWGTGAGNLGGLVLDIGFRCATFGQSAVLVGDYFKVTEIQLEKGSTATPFDYRPYGTELALCQRYGYPPAIGIICAQYGSYNASGNYCPHPVPMRASPTLSGVTSWTVQGRTASASNVTVGTNTLTYTVGWTGTNGIGDGSAALINPNQQGFFSAEL